MSPTPPASLFLSNPAYKALSKSDPATHGPISPSFLKPFPPPSHHHVHQPSSNHPLSVNNSYRESSSSKLPTRRELVILLVAFFGSVAVFCLTFGQIKFNYLGLNGSGQSLDVGFGLGAEQLHRGGNGDRLSTGFGMWDEDVRGDNGMGEYHETEIVQHAPGWTIYSNLSPETFPEIRMMTSTSAEVFNGDEAVAAREPTDENMRIISPAEAHVLFRSEESLHTFGLSPIRQSGATWLVNDPPQFITHFYHFGAELLFGLWRTFSSQDTGINVYGDTTHLGTPRRMIFTSTGYDHWRDYSGMNGLLMMSVFPRMKLEFQEDYELDRVHAHRPFVYEQITFADRAASMRGERFLKTGRSASEAATLPSSPYWFAPLRRKVLEYVGVPVSDLEPGERALPVVTYVSRQAWGRRMLKEADHLELVRTLSEAAKEDGFEFNVVEMDKLDKQQQVRLAARTTIMLGVHGNGLSHLLWMKPTSRSTVIEMFYPGGFATDYEFTARGLGIQHYGFWGKDRFTSPDLPEVAYPEGFQGNEIPIDAKAVLDVVRSRLGSDEEADDG